MVRRSWRLGLGLCGTAFLALVISGAEGEGASRSAESAESQASRSLGHHHIGEEGQWQGDDELVDRGEDQCIRQVIDVSIHDQQIFVRRTVAGSPLVTLKVLSPAKHRIRVRCRNHAGVWNHGVLDPGETLTLGDPSQPRLRPADLWVCSEGGRQRLACVLDFVDGPYQVPLLGSAHR